MKKPQVEMSIRGEQLSEDVDEVSVDCHTAAQDQRTNTIIGVEDDEIVSYPTIDPTDDETAFKSVSVEYIDLEHTESSTAEDRKSVEPPMEILEETAWESLDTELEEPRSRRSHHPELDEVACDLPQLELEADNIKSRRPSNLAVVDQKEDEIEVEATWRYHEQATVESVSSPEIPMTEKDTSGREEEGTWGYHNIAIHEPVEIPMTAEDTCGSLAETDQYANDQHEFEYNKSPVSYLTCPQCRAEHKIIEPNGVNGFLTDFVIENQLRERRSSTNGSSDLIHCDGCNENSEPVVACCYDCAEYLCEFCSKAHQRLKKFVGHNVRVLSGLDKDCKETIVLRKPQERYVCARHPTETVQLYCQSCDAIVCNKCIVSCADSGHKLSEIDSITRKKVHKQLFSLSEKVSKGLKQEMKNLNYVKRVEKATNEMATDVQQKINNICDSYVAALEKRRKELLTESESKCNEKIKVLWSEKDSLERVVADMTTTQNFTERIKNCEDNKEFLLLSSQSLPRLKKLESWKWKDGVVEEIEHYSLDFQESDLNVGLISGAGRLNEDRVLYKIDFQEFTDTATLGKQHSFKIHVTRGKCCRPWMRIKTPKVSLKHIQSNFCDVANIRIKSTDKQALFDSGMDDEEKWEITNKWKITYTPYCGGRHTLTIKVEDVLTHVKEITVLGRPPVGSTVMCGPDSHSTVEGTVVSRSAYFSDSSTVNVQVQERFGYYHRSITTKTFSWGKNGRYEIQLRH